MAFSFLTATLIALALTPALKRLAVAIDFVDQPSSRKSHSKSVAYLGGVAIVVATSAGALVGSFGGARTILLLAGGAILATVGLIDDKRHLGAGPRLLAQLAMAGAAYAAGIRAVATGVPALDLLITVLWIAGMANSLNFFDNMDGLAAGTAVVAGLSLFVVAALGGQYRIATIAIALAGACLGFLGFNFRPATIYMGDAGSLFLGFLLSTLTLQVAPDVAPPASFVVPLLLLGVPLLDTATVVLGRLRHGHTPLHGGQDHLSHRLVAKGFSRERAVGLLIAAQALFGVLAVLAARRVVPLPWTLTIALVALALLAWFAGRGHMYSNPRQPLPRRLKVAAAAPFVLFGLATVPAVVALVSVREPVAAGAASAEQAITAAREGDAEKASQLFARAEEHFGQPSADLGGPLKSMGLAVPAVSSNLRAARVLVETGRRLSTAGRDIATTSDPNSLAFRDGQADLAALAALTPKLERAVVVLREAQTDVRSVRYPYLAPTLEAALQRLDTDLTAALDDADRAVTVARVLPAIFGSGEPRRYFLAIQNNAEARATGGFIGNFGEVVTANGRVHLARFGRIGELNSRPGEDRELVAPADFVDRYDRFDVANTWQNVNVSPDLPTVTRVIADLYPRSGGTPVDGVISVDPAGLAGLLRLTGPVSVPGWGTPISAENVVTVTLEEAYAHFPDQERRVGFLGDVARIVFERATAGNLGSARQIIDALAEPARRGHLQVALLDEAEARAMRKVGLSGSVPPPTGDSLLLTTQNAAGNKIDTYLRRTLRYDLEIAPAADGAADVAGTVTIALDNLAPANRLPSAIIGPYDTRFAPGENRAFVSLYTPLELEAAAINGVSTGLESGRELGRQVYSTFVSIPPEGRQELTLRLHGRVPLAAGSRYRLDLLRQPVLSEDRVEVRVRAAPGWALTAGLGLQPESPVVATVRADVGAPRALSVRVVEAKDRSVIDRLLGPPRGTLDQRRRLVHSSS